MAEFTAPQLDILLAILKRIMEAVEKLAELKTKELDRG